MTKPSLYRETIPSQEFEKKVSMGKFAELTATAIHVLPALRFTLSIVPKGPFPIFEDDNIKDSDD